MLDRPRRRRHDVEVEDFRRQPQRGASIRHVDNARYMALDRRRSENGIGLRARITELLQILDGIQTRLTIGNRYIQIVLLALLVDRDALKNQEVLVVRRHRRRLENRIFDAVLRHAVLDDIDLDVEPAGHLDGAAEGNFAVALAEMQIAHREACTRNIDREVDFRTARQILDVAVAAVLARRNGTRAFSSRFRLGVTFKAAHMRGRTERRVGQTRHAGRVGRDQRGLALVPHRQHLRIGQTADQAGMNQAREVDAGDVPRRGVHALEVPDRLLGQREMIGEKSAAVLLGEETVEAPEALLHRADVEQIDHQQIARLRALHANRA